MKSRVSYRLKDRRLALGLKQEDLARQLNLTQAQISKYERGESEPPADILYVLAKVLDTSSDYLLGLSDVVRPVSTAEGLDAAEKNLIEIYRSKSPEAQNKLIDVAKVI